MYEKPFTFTDLLDASLVFEFGVAQCWNGLRPLKRVHSHGFDEAPRFTSVQRCGLYAWASAIIASFNLGLVRVLRFVTFNWQRRLC